MATEALDLPVSSVLITGANGTLGRSIFDLLLRTFPSVKLVRLFDNNPEGKEYFEGFLAKGKSFATVCFVTQLVSTLPSA